MIVYSVALLFGRVLDYFIMKFYGHYYKELPQSNALRHGYFFALRLDHSALFVHELVSLSNFMNNEELLLALNVKDGL
jgi:hypothetical protein